MAYAIGTGTPVAPVELEMPLQLERKLRTSMRKGGRPAPALACRLLFVVILLILLVLVLLACLQHRKTPLMACGSSQVPECKSPS
jgi:hypothetical protein